MSSKSSPEVQEWESLLTAAFLAAPDKYEPLPLSNKPETIYGSILSFLVVAWAAVLLRLWVRLRLVKEPGWDDFLVFVAALCNTIATITVCFSVKYGGLGHHMLYHDTDTISTYFLTFWLAHSVYLTETTVIKVSLLVQYLRIFKAGRMRWLCLGLAGLITLWGLAFSFIGWFPCFPVRAMWDRTGHFKCYGFGYSDHKSFIAMFQIHSASNMVFDLAVFVIPLVLFRAPNLKGKNFLALAGMFSIGAVAVMISIWRLYSIVLHKAALAPYPDFTWWTPTSIVLTCLEIDLAIICASMPIFWPVIEKSFEAIFISHEIQVVETRVENHGLAYELEHTKSQKQHRRGSSTTSTRELTATGSEDGYKEFSVGVDPLSAEAQNMGPETNIDSGPRRKWEI